MFLLRSPYLLQCEPLEGKHGCKTQENCVSARGGRHSKSLCDSNFSIFSTAGSFGQITKLLPKQCQFGNPSTKITENNSQNTSVGKTEGFGNCIESTMITEIDQIQKQFCSEIQNKNYRNYWRQIWRVAGRESGSPELLGSPRTSPEVPRTSPEVFRRLPRKSSHCGT